MGRFFPVINTLTEKDGCDEEDTPDQQAEAGKGKIECRLRIANKDRCGKAESGGLQQEGGQRGSGGVDRRANDEVKGESDEDDEEGVDQPADNDWQGLGEQAWPGSQGRAVPGIEGEVIGHRIAHR